MWEEGDASANGTSVQNRDVSDYKGYCVHYDEGATSQMVARQPANESLIVKHKWTLTKNEWHLSLVEVNKGDRKTGTFNQSICVDILHSAEQGWFQVLTCINRPKPELA